MTKIYFCINFNENFTETDIEISSFDLYGESFKIPLRKNNGKRQYDGTIIYTIDISFIECYDIISIKKYKEKDIFFYFIAFKSVEYFGLFDYKSYKNEVLYNIS